jgi:hypothetical protein
MTDSVVFSRPLRTGDQRKSCALSILARDKRESGCATCLITHPLNTWSWEKLEDDLDPELHIELFAGTKARGTVEVSDSITYQAETTGSGARMSG